MTQEDALKQLMESLTKGPVLKGSKEPWDWVESDIQRMIKDKVRENIGLDYKAAAALEKSDKKKNGVSKDVSSFANSAGGTIVYGVSENTNYEPDKIDGGYDISDISGEWLEQVINSNIQPKVQGIRINQIALSTEAPGRVIYAVYIPQSLTAHQASDKKYYKRYNLQSAPMEDWEIKDILNRGTCPDLKIILDIEKGEKAAVTFKKDQRLSEPIPINVFIRNDGRGVAEYSAVILNVPSSIQLSVPGFASQPLDATYNKLSMNLFVPQHMPVFKEAGSWLIATGALRLSTDIAPMYHISWSVVAPQMEAKVGVAILTIAEGKLSVIELHKSAAEELQKLITGIRAGMNARKQS